MDQRNTEEMATLPHLLRVKPKINDQHRLSKYTKYTEAHSAERNNTVNHYTTHHNTVTQQVTPSNQIATTTT
jgi:hypothetical protein